MTVFKCKMCGGSIDVVNNESVAECEYCGTKQTLPKMDDEKRINLYNRANHFRQQCAFDKAEQIYEKIVAEMPDDAEAHWSLVLCRYGIEYVEDPSTLERVPTCHRASYDSIFDDIDYIEAVNKADTIAVSLYKKEAAKIDRIQKGILELSKKEKPFDVFICYKETDSTGERTLDSVKAQEIYDALTDKGYKVFFSRITLEDKLGQAYEPYIFAALNSAKVMLVVGTNPDYINAVWVKNEWSRYLKIMSKKKDRTLIPCYLNISPYELPDELSYLQGQDMSKIGFMQDLVKGIGKLIPKTVHSVEESSGQNKLKGLINLINFAIEEQNWDKADNLCEQLMMTQPNSVLYYFFKLFIGNRQGKNIANISKKLSNLQSEISDEEKVLINEKNSEEYFWIFIKNNCTSRAKYILQTFPEIILKNYNTDVKDEYISALSYAVVKLKNIVAVKNLLEIGINPDKSYRVTNKNKHNLLSDAIEFSKNADIVKLILEYGADPNSIEHITYDDGTEEQKSMLSYAIVDAKSVEIVKILLDYGADLNTSCRVYSNKYGQTHYSLLGDAIWNAKNIDMVRMFLQHGLKANIVEDIVYDDGNKGKKSMLTYAICDAENKEIVSLLIEYGAKWDNVITYCGITKVEKYFPYQKYVSKDWVKFLKTQDWKGSIFG